jgi:hypothetical protein
VLGRCGEEKEEKATFFLLLLLEAAKSAIRFEGCEREVGRKEDLVLRVCCMWLWLVVFGGVGACWWCWELLALSLYVGLLEVLYVCMYVYSLLHSCHL